MDHVPVTTASRGAAAAPPLRLLQQYARALEQIEAAALPGLQQLVTAHIHDLIALTRGATRDAPEGAKARGAGAAWLDAVMTGIEQHLANPALSAAWLGVRLGLSDRYVHHLLAGAGARFSAIVRRKRVERARQMLEQAAAMPRIIDVAYAVGFSDLSSFNRAFRRHFDCTPSDVLYRRSRM